MSVSRIHHLIPLLQCHLALSVSFPPCILPSLQIQCGGTAADAGFSSSLYSAGPNCCSLAQTGRAALSLAGHTMLQQTAQQRRRQLQRPQFSAPLAALVILRKHLKRLQLNHYFKEGEEGDERTRGRRNQTERGGGVGPFGGLNQRDWVNKLEINRKLSIVLPCGEKKNKTQGSET